MTTDLSDFRVAAADLGHFGHDFNRPECVLCTASGDIFVSRWEGGGVTHVRPDGSQQDIICGTGPDAPKVGTNGFAISPEGDFLLANLHDEGGGAWRLRRDGSNEPFLTEIDGKPIPPTNYVGVDRKGRTWITVSTWQQPRQLAYRRDVADGFIILVDEKGPRIAAEGIGYTNEAVVDASGDWLYVNETYGRRTSRYRIGQDDSLGPRETVAEYGHGTYPDGMAFDEEGGVWLTSVVSNRIIRVAPDGSQTVVLEDSDPEELDRLEQILQSEGLKKEHMDAVKSQYTRHIASIAFGGPDRKTVYLGNLLDTKLYTFRSPVAGMRMSHWDIRF